MAVRDMLTEDEAKTKWCPLGRNASIVTPAFNRWDGEPSGSNCIASNCAFWRWSHQDSNDSPTGFCGGAILPKYI